MNSSSRTCQATTITQRRFPRAFLVTQQSAESRSRAGSVAESEVAVRNKSETASGSVKVAIPQQSLSSTFDGDKQADRPTGLPTAGARSSRIVTYEFIDSGELARRWDVPVSWIRDQVRRRAEDPLPHVNLGKYVRFLVGQS